MYNHSIVLVAAGSLCLTITLVLAWRLAGDVGRRGAHASAMPERPDSLLNDCGLKWP